MALPQSKRTFPHRILWLVALLLTATLAYGEAHALAAPKPVPRTITAVTAELDRLARQTEQLAEQYNASSAQAAAAARKAQLAEARARAAAAAVSRAHDEFVSIVTAQWEGGSINAASALLTSKDPQDYLDQLTALHYLSQRQAGAVKALQRADTVAHAAAERAAADAKAARHRRDLVAQHRSAVVHKTAVYKRLLAKLTAAQRRAYAERAAASARQAAAARQDAAQPAASHSSHYGSSVQPGSAPSAAAREAVQFALAQVGKPYVFAAAGPNAYDCSGLTMAAWKHAGVSLPHLASAQYDYGTHVSANDLLPGDLVFFYHPIGHVAMYIGHGLLVSAPQPGENVEVVKLSYFMSDYVGATRLG